MRGGRSSSGVGGAQPPFPPPLPPFPFGGLPFRCAPFVAAIRGSAAPAPSWSFFCARLRPKCA
jgi:hypothetical protein